MIPPLDKHDVLAWWQPREPRVPFAVDSQGVAQLIGYLPSRNADGSWNDVFSNYEEQRRRNEMASYHRYFVLSECARLGARQLTTGGTHDT